MRHTPQRDGHAPGDHAHAPTATDLKRRRFLLALGTATAGSATAAVHGFAPARIPAGEEEKTGGYQETDHVRDYYASARI